MSSRAIPFISILLFLMVLELQGLGQEQLGHVGLSWHLTGLVKLRTVRMLAIDCHGREVGRCARVILLGRPRQIGLQVRILVRREASRFQGRFIHGLRQVRSIDHIGPICHDRELYSVDIRSKLLIDSIFILDRLIDVDVMLVDEAQELGAPLAKQPRLAIVVRDSILWNWHLYDLLKPGAFMLDVGSIHA